MFQIFINSYATKVSVIRHANPLSATIESGFQKFTFHFCVISTFFLALQVGIRCKCCLSTCTAQPGVKNQIPPAFPPPASLYADYCTAELLLFDHIKPKTPVGVANNLQARLH